jgi:hypothetical protein
MQRFVQRGFAALLIAFVVPTGSAQDPAPAPRPPVLHVYDARDLFHRLGAGDEPNAAVWQQLLWILRVCRPDFPTDRLTTQKGIVLARLQRADQAWLESCLTRLRRDALSAFEIEVSTLVVDSALAKELLPNTDAATERDPAETARILRRIRAGPRTTKMRTSSVVLRGLAPKDLLKGASDAPGLVATAFSADDGALGVVCHVERADAGETVQRSFTLRDGRTTWLSFPAGGKRTLLVLTRLNSRSVPEPERDGRGKGK